MPGLERLVKNLDTEGGKLYPGTFIYPVPVRIPFLKIVPCQVFLRHIQKLPKDDIKVLIGDNLAAHLSPVVTELCQQHNIRYGMVPYCTYTYGT